MPPNLETMTEALDDLELKIACCREDPNDIGQIVRTAISLSDVYLVFEDETETKTILEKIFSKYKGHSKRYWRGFEILHQIEYDTPVDKILEYTRKAYKLLPGYEYDLSILASIVDENNYASKLIMLKRLSREFEIQLSLNRGATNCDLETQRGGKILQTNERGLRLPSQGTAYMSQTTGTTLVSIK